MDVYPVFYEFDLSFITLMNANRLFIIAVLEAIKIVVGSKVHSISNPIVRVFFVLRKNSYAYSVIKR